MRCVLYSVGGLTNGRAFHVTTDFLRERLELSGQLKIVIYLGENVLSHKEIIRKSKNSACAQPFEEEMTFSANGLSFEIVRDLCL